MSSGIYPPLTEEQSQWEDVNSINNTQMLRYRNAGNADLSVLMNSNYYDYSSLYLSARRHAHSNSSFVPTDSNKQQQQQQSSQRGGKGLDKLSNNVLVNCSSSFLLHPDYSNVEFPADVDEDTPRTNLMK